MNKLYKNYTKRLLDIIFSLLGSIILIIIIIPIGILIYLEDKGPIFYNANRLGKKGKTFKMYKFRTMKVNAPDIRNKDGSTYNEEDDPRLTKIGKILRKTSIDELPQILNVLKGEMSFIGPRPDLPEHIKKYTEKQKIKLDVLPGITGYNQAYYRNSVEWDKRLENDAYYVKNLSLSLDFKIIIKTFLTVLKSDGIYIKNDKYKNFKLDWDTNYFKVSSGKLELNGEINKKNIKKILKQYEFTTILNKNNNYNNNKIINKYTKAILTDINIQLEKEVTNSTKEDYIKISNNVKKNKAMLEIAKTSFVYSRFTNDINLNQEKAKLVYYNWLNNAFEKEDKFICEYNKNEKCYGFLLFNINKSENKATIELIATNKNKTNKGIGSSLIKSLEAYCNSQNIKKIQVGTQLENITAQNFYIKNGFKIKSYNSIYHNWR